MLPSTVLVWLSLIIPCPNLIGAESSFDKPVAKVAAESDQSWWSLEPVKRVTPPRASDQAWMRTPIDQIILARLDGKI